MIGEWKMQLIIKSIVYLNQVMVQLMVKPCVKGHVTPMSILVDVNIDHDR